MPRLAQAGLVRVLACPRPWTILSRQSCSTVALTPLPLDLALSVSARASTRGGVPVRNRVYDQMHTRTMVMARARTNTRQTKREELIRGALVDAAKAAQLDPENFETHKALAIGKGRLQVRERERVWRRGARMCRGA